MGITAYGIENGMLQNATASTTVRSMGKKITPEARADCCTCRNEFMTHGTIRVSANAGEVQVALPGKEYMKTHSCELKRRSLL